MGLLYAICYRFSAPKARSSRAAGAHCIGAFPAPANPRACCTAPDLESSSSSKAQNDSDGEQFSFLFCVFFAVFFRTVPSFSTHAHTCTHTCTCTCTCTLTLTLTHFRIHGPPCWHHAPRSTRLIEPKLHTLATGPGDGISHLLCPCRRLPHLLGLTLVLALLLCSV